VTRDVRELASAWTTFQQHEFAPPSADLARSVERYWIVSWAYDEPYRQLIVPYPNVHLTFQDGGATVHGVSTRHQVKVLSGSGGVFGVAFRPGTFRPFLRASVSTIRNRSVDARTVFRSPLPDPLDVPAVEGYLRAQLPDRDAEAEEAAAMVEKILATPEVTTVESLAADLRLSVRRLQRLFAQHVGVPPKWVIRRYRLHEVTQRLAAGAQIDWAALAADLGYADQPHFVRDFTKMFGESPTRYAERY
jgi:AraC-like DNA-binding protein